MSSDPYFTDSKIEELVTKHDWEMVPSENGLYKLRQKGRHHITTLDFPASEETVNRHCAIDFSEVGRGVIEVYDVMEDGDD